MFKKGMFGIKRSSKSFSRSPIDLALEQTINADAANQRTGIGSDGQNLIFCVCQSYDIYSPIIKHEKKRRYHIKFETA